MNSWTYRDHPPGVISDAYDAELYTEARVLANGRPLMVWKQANDPCELTSLDESWMPIIWTCWYVLY